MGDGKGGDNFFFVIGALYMHQQSRTVIFVSKHAFECNNTHTLFCMAFSSYWSKCNFFLSGLPTWKVVVTNVKVGTSCVGSIPVFFSAHRMCGS